MAAFWQDVKYGARMMLRTPVVSAVAVVSLALGIAANASMFAVVDGFFFEPLPYADQDELVLFRTVRGGENLDLAGGLSAPNFDDLTAGLRGIESATIYTIERANLTGRDIPEQLSVVVATPSLFDVFGVQPVLGRGFRPEDVGDGVGRVLVLEHDYWQRRFLGDTTVLGRSVTLDGAPYTIVGIMAEDFDMVPASIHAIRPTDFADLRDDRASRRLFAFARLTDGTTSSMLQEEMDAISARLSTEFPEANRGIRFLAQPLRDFFPGPTDAQLLKILTAVTLFGLLIACANIANLLLGRAEERQKEVALRTAIGAGRGRILRQLVTESVLMAAVAGALGTVLAIWVVRWLRTAMPAEMPAAFFPELDPGVLAATLGVSVLAGIAFGLAPALHAVTGSLRESLTGGGRGGTAGRSRKRLRNAFVVGEVAVALALLSGAGFLVQAFERLTGDDPGFEVEGLLTFQLSVLERYEGDGAVARYQGEIVRALAALPSVQGVAVMSSLPRGRSNPSVPFTVVGRPVQDPNERPTTMLQSVNPAYFGTMEIDLLRGRRIDETDRADAAPVAVVSAGLAAIHFPGEDPVGRAIEVAGRERQIVGVVETIAQDRIALSGDRGEQVYLPLAQAPVRTPSFAVRLGGEPGSLAADVRQAVWSVDPDQPVAEVQTLRAYIDASLAGPRAMSTFLVALGVIALALAAMGIYGVMAHSVTQQQREIGIRMALGADRGSVVGMVVRSGLSLVGVGVLLGVPLVYLMYRGAVVGLDIFETDPGFTYPIVLAAALLGVASVATLLPAGRASGVAPASALND